MPSSESCRFKKNIWKGRMILTPCCLKNIKLRYVLDVNMFDRLLYSFGCFQFQLSSLNQDSSNWVQCCMKWRHFFVLKLMRKSEEILEKERAWDEERRKVTKLVSWENKSLWERVIELFERVKLRLVIHQHSDRPWALLCWLVGRFLLDSSVYSWNRSWKTGSSMTRTATRSSTTANTTTPTAYRWGLLSCNYSLTIPDTRHCRAWR